MLEKRKAKFSVKNQKGTSTIEVVPILAVFVLILNYGLGFFGVLHSGILNSIASRNYAFETFRNRANLNYLRDVGASLENVERGYYNRVGFRYHVIVSESSPNPDRFIASKRSIKFTEISGVSDPLGGSVEHNQQVSQIAEGRRVSEVFGSDRGGVDPVWIKSAYGICLNGKCVKMVN